MTFTERIEKLLASNHLKEVIDEFLKFLSEVPQSNRDARNDANQLRGQVIILSGQFTDLNTKITSGTIDPAVANRERASITNSFVQILNQLPLSYPDLNNYVAEKNEDDEWKEAQRKNTIEEYQEYFSKYPNGKYKAATIKLIAELEEVKQKQDAEIKRLAALEKERRTNDKAAAEETAAKKAAYSDKTKQPFNSTGTGGGYETSKPKSRTALYVALGALIGILFIIMLAVIYAPSAETKPADIKKDNSLVTPEEPSKTDANDDALQAEVRLAFEAANQTLLNATYTLNASVLNKSFSGEALKIMQTRITDLISNNIYVQGILVRRDYKSIALLNNKTEARVDTDETWNYIYYNNFTKLCTGRQSNWQDGQSVYLKKTAQGWMVTSFILGNNPAPPMELCE